jgi:hypothetical protein
MKTLTFNLTTGLSLVATALLLSGCGSSSIEQNIENQTGVNNSQIFNGNVADGYLVGAKVCADINTNSVCDVGEPSVITDANGHYALELNDEESLAPIIAQIDEDTIDTDDGLPVGTSYVLRSVSGAEGFLSPLSTLVVQQLEADATLSVEEAKRIVAEQLGLEEGVDLFKDYVKENSKAYKKAHTQARIIGKMYKTMNEKLEELGIDTTNSFSAAKEFINNDIVLQNLQEIARLSEDENVDTVVAAASLLADELTIESASDIVEKIRVFSIENRLSRQDNKNQNIEQNSDVQELITAIQSEGGLYQLHRDKSPSYDEKFMMRISKYEDNDADTKAEVTSTWYNKELSVVEEFLDSNRSHYLLGSEGWHHYNEDLTAYSIGYEKISDENVSSLILTNEAGERFSTIVQAKATLDERRFGRTLSRYSDGFRGGFFSEGAVSYRLNATSLQSRYMVRPFVYQEDENIERLLENRGSAVSVSASVLALDSNVSQITFTSIENFKNHFTFLAGSEVQVYAPAPSHSGVAFGNNGIAYMKLPLSNILVEGSFIVEVVNGIEVLRTTFESQFHHKYHHTSMIFSVVDGEVKIGNYTVQGQSKTVKNALYNKIAYDDLNNAINGSI